MSIAFGIFDFPLNVAINFLWAILRINFPKCVSQIISLSRCLIKVWRVTQGYTRSGSINAISPFLHIHEANQYFKDFEKIYIKEACLTSYPCISQTYLTTGTLVYIIPFITAQNFINLDKPRVSPNPIVEDDLQSFLLCGQQRLDHR